MKPFRELEELTLSPREKGSSWAKWGQCIFTHPPSLPPFFSPPPSLLPPSPSQPPSPLPPSLLPPSFLKYLLGLSDMTGIVLGTVDTVTHVCSHWPPPAGKSPHSACPPLRLRSDVTHSQKPALTSTPSLPSQSPTLPEPLSVPVWHLSRSTLDYSYLCTQLISLPD